MRRSQRQSFKDREHSFDFSQPGAVQYATAFESKDGLRLRYELDDAQINGQLGSLLPPELADLIDIAVAAHISDRLGVRGQTVDSPLWHRSLNVMVPVRCPGVWARPDVQEALGSLLEFLTEDNWQFQFSHRPPCLRRLSEAQQSLFPHAIRGPVHVSLFSGGLDSFAGTAAAIASRPNRNFICVSGVTNHRHGDRQRKQVQQLRQLRPDTLSHVRVDCWLKDADEIRQEPTRRTRGFLFLAIGAATAVMANTRELWLFENGVGALNLPFMTGELGVTTSRSVHPRTLTLMADLVARITERRFAIHNGALFLTKGQLCSQPSIASVLDAIPLTFSCDGFPLRRRGPTQCGVCTSCLLRRQSLWSAGLARYDLHDYRYDLCGSTRVLTPKHLRGVREMHWQVTRLVAALDQRYPWQGMLNEFPQLALAQQSLVEQLGICPSVAADRLIALYRRHCDEWALFPGSALGQANGKAA